MAVDAGQQQMGCGVIGMTFEIGKEEIAAAVKLALGHGLPRRLQVCPGTPGAVRHGQAGADENQQQGDQEQAAAAHFNSMLCSCLPELTV